jgi:hypothetical protein
MVVGTVGFGASPALFARAAAGARSLPLAERGDPPVQSAGARPA